MESQKILMTEDMVNEKIKVTEAFIIIGGTIEKPYYSILYDEVGTDYHTIGFGSYYLDNVRKWKEEYLELVEDV